MTDCTKCLFYSKEKDEEQRGSEDVAIVGKEAPNNHYCLSFPVIPPGYFEGEKSCDKFLPRQ